MKLIPFYKAVLGTAALKVNAENMVSAHMQGNSIPFMVKGKRLVLPTHEHLSNPDKSGIVVFHPLSENVLGDESAVMEKFRNALNIRLNYILGVVVDGLLVLGTSVAEHAKLTPDQAEVLGIMKDADEKTLTNYRAILKNMGIGNKEKCFVDIFLKRGGMVNGKKYNRAAIVHFPLYKELNKRDKQTYGVILRKKDYEIFIKLLEFIIPGIENETFFNKGSESDLGPFLDALMRCVAQLASRINQTVEMYRGQYDNPDELIFESDWVECFDNLAQLLPEVRAIPMQAGNNSPAPMVANAVAPMNNLAVAPVNTPVVNQVAQAMQPVTQPQSAPLSAPKSSGTLDLHAALNNNPAFRQVPVGFGGFGGNQFGVQPQMSGPQALRNQTPRWAQPQFGVPQAGFNQMQQPMNYGYQQPVGLGNV